MFILFSPLSSMPGTMHIFGINQLRNEYRNEIKIRILNPSLENTKGELGRLTFIQRIGSKWKKNEHISCISVYESGIAEVVLPAPRSECTEIQSHTYDNTLTFRLRFLCETKVLLNVLKPEGCPISFEKKNEQRVLKRIIFQLEWRREHVIMAPFIWELLHQKLWDVESLSKDK